MRNIVPDFENPHQRGRYRRNKITHQCRPITDVTLSKSLRFNLILYSLCFLNWRCRDDDILLHPKLNLGEQESLGSVPYLSKRFRKAPASLLAYDYLLCRSRNVSIFAEKI